MEQERINSAHGEIIPEISKELYKDKATNCQKCLNKLDFVSVSDFAYNSHSFLKDHNSSIACHYLPDSYNRQDVYELVMALIPLTVLLEFTCKFSACATGEIIQVELDSTNDAESIIHVVTTWHFGKYFSANESQLSCVLDYDYERKRGESLQMTGLSFHDERKRGESLQVTGLSFHDEESDICVLLCKTLDSRLAKKIKRRLKTFRKLFKELYDRMKRIKKAFLGCVTSQWTLCDLVIIVSHPHGGPKKISVGRRIERDPGRGGGQVTQELCYSYTANTCQACSGAPLLVLGAPSCNVFLLHRGKLLESRTNICTPGYRLKKKRHVPHLCKFWSGK